MPEVVHRDEPLTLSVRVVSQQQTRAPCSAASRRRAARRAQRYAARRREHVHLQVAAAAARRGGVTAEVQAESDELPDNDRMTQAIWVSARPRVLYAEGQREASGYLRDALTREGLDVTIAQPLPSCQKRPTVCSSFDAVIVSDVPASDLGTCAHAGFGELCARSGLAA